MVFLTDCLNIKDSCIKEGKRELCQEFIGGTTVQLHYFHRGFHDSILSFVMTVSFQSVPCTYKNSNSFCFELHQFFDIYFYTNRITFFTRQSVCRSASRAYHISKSADIPSKFMSRKDTCLDISSMN